MISDILLDMDDVVVNLNRGLFKHFPVLENNRNEWDVSKTLGVTIKQFIKLVDKIPDFWIDLEPLPRGLELYYELKKIAPVHFVSSPTGSAVAAAGKTIWLKKYFGEDFDDYVITSKKHLLAKPGVLLLDDRHKNVEEFIGGGGLAVLYPQPWNPLAQYTDSAFEVSLDTIKKYI
jgi:5'(3')-deoxyribonucleotidase